MQVSPSAWELGKNYGIDVAMLGDVRRVMAALTEIIDCQLTDSVRKACIDRIMQALSCNKSEASKSEVSDNSHASATDSGEAMHQAMTDARIVAEAPTSVKGVKSAYSFGPGDYFATCGGGDSGGRHPEWTYGL